MKWIKRLLHELRSLHPFSRDILHGSAQFAFLLWLFGVLMQRIAGYTPDVLRCLQYADAAIENAPAMLAAGVACALAADLALRRGRAKEPRGPENSQEAKPKEDSPEKPDSPPGPLDK